MPDDTVHGFVCREIQNIDEVVPARIEKNRMLIGPELLGMDAEVLINRPNLHVAIPHGGDADLHADLAIVRCKRLLTQHDIHVEGPDGEFEHRFLSRHGGEVGVRFPVARSLSVDIGVQYTQYGVDFRGEAGQAQQWVFLTGVRF